VTTARDRDDKQHQRCSFCGKGREQVHKLVAGPGVTICNDCIILCEEVLAQEEIESSNKSWNKNGFPAFPTPQEIYDKLSEYVIGQDQAKKVLAVAAYNHYKRIGQRPKQGQIEIDKSNILILGATGSGKSLLVKTLGRILDVPVAICDATSITSAGYVGDDVENVLLRLLQLTDFDIARAEKGIVFLDELGKTGRKSENPSITRDVSGEGTQQALLKMVEGTVAHVPPQGGRKHPHQEMIAMKTDQILFIGGDSWDGLGQIIEARLNKKQIGFSSSSEKSKTKSKDIPQENLFKSVKPDDLIKFGMLPELIGRFPILVATDPLNSEDLLKILTEPKNALIKQFQQMFAVGNVELEFTEDALNAIVEKTIDLKTGARGLRSIVEETLLPIMFDTPSQPDVTRVVIDEDTVNNQAPAQKFLAEPKPIPPPKEAA
jgi:ATP-dependent Clp protease ATP-binding subunit ClpX